MTTKYQKHYDALVERARHRAIEGYCERHHVLPRCMGGDNDPRNLVRLTAEEHYVAHQLLVRMYPSVGGLATAAVRMARQCSGNKAYAWLRRRHAEAVSLRAKGNRYGLGYTRTEEERARISAALKGRKKSVETKRRMSKAQCGNKKAFGLKRGPPTAEHREKNAAARRGKKMPPRTEEHKAKISAARISYFERLRHERNM